MRSSVWRRRSGPNAEGAEYRSQPVAVTLPPTNRTLVGRFVGVCVAGRVDTGCCGAAGQQDGRIQPQPEEVRDAGGLGLRVGDELLVVHLKPAEGGVVPNGLPQADDAVVQPGRSTERVELGHTGVVRELLEVGAEHGVGRVPSGDDQRRVGKCQLDRPQLHHVTWKLVD